MEMKVPLFLLMCLLSLCVCVQNLWHVVGVRFLQGRSHDFFTAKSLAQRITVKSNPI